MAGAGTAVGAAPPLRPTAPASRRGARRPAPADPGLMAAQGRRGPAPRGGGAAGRQPVVTRRRRVGPRGGLGGRRGGVGTRTPTRELALPSTRADSLAG